jgi:murein DD-endopeptidase MepM/ murein hydrolase activator NlpD
MAGASLFFDIFARDNNVSDTLDKVGKKADDTASRTEKLGGKLSGLAGPAAVGIGAVGALAFKFGGMAADAEQNVGAVSTVFGEAASKVEEYADRAATAVGMSESQYNQLSATTGTALKAAGVSVDQLAEKNDMLITRGADLASVFGGTTAEAVQAMGSAFRGEFDPLERYGVTLNMNSVNAELAARGLDGLSGAAAETAKKQVIMDLILQQSAGSAGNFAREADTASGAQQRANASWDDAQAKLGEALLPALSSLATLVKDASKWIGENAGLVQNLAIVLAVLAGGIVVASTAMTVLNIVMAANPIGIVILAVAGLIAVIALLAANWGTITKFVSTEWTNLSNGLSEGMRQIGTKWNNLWSGMGSFLNDSWNNVIIKPFQALKGWVTNDIPNAFRDGMGWVETHWNKLKDVAKSPVKFLVNTVINDGLINTFNTVAGWVGIGKLGRVSLPPGFAEGGYTGEGSKHDPAGIVHKGEFVFTKEEVANAGVNNLYAMAQHLRGYAGGGYVHPAPGAVVSQGYHANHNGIDLAGPLGSPIRAAMSGNVVFAGWSAHGGGNEIHIKHPGGMETWYAHMSRFKTTQGVNVQRGQRIGDMGSTGNSTGSHLHFMALVGGWPRHVNPGPYMQGGGDIPDAGIPFDPIGDIAKGLLGSLRSAFPAGAMAADLAFGFGGKILGEVGKSVMSKLGMGGTYGPTVFDDGGWLDTVGANRSGRPEPVFSDPQWNSIHTLAARGASLDGYTLVLNADMTRATLRRDARAAAEDLLAEVNDDIYRGRAR